MVPVSYTHLDVYKRQDYARVERCAPGEAAPRVRALIQQQRAVGKGWSLQAQQTVQGPVSYTHLDVYKRQLPEVGDLVHAGAHLEHLVELFAQRADVYKRQGKTQRRGCTMPEYRVLRIDEQL